MTPARGPAAALAIAVLALLAAGPLAAQSGDRSLGSFRDWQATRFGSGADLACMAFTQPKKSEGDYTQRGEAFVFVTIRPGAGGTGISIETGYPYREGSPARVVVDEVQVDLNTEGSTAWVSGDDEVQRLVRAMRAGRSMRVTGTSSRGTETADEYSLYGFTAAHQAIRKACSQS